MNEFDWALNSKRQKVFARLHALDETERHTLVKEAGLPQGYFMSSKMGCPMPWWRRCERDLMCLMDTDFRVLSYQLFFNRVDAMLNGERGEHFAMFAVNVAGSWTAIDVGRPKAGADLLTSGNTGLLEEVYRQHGWKYRRLGERALRQKHRLANARTLLEARSFYAPEHAIRVVMRELSLGGPKTLAQLKATLPAQPDVRLVVCCLVLRGQLTLNLDHPEFDLSVVSLKQGSVQR